MSTSILSFFKLNLIIALNCDRTESRHLSKPWHLSVFCLFVVFFLPLTVILVICCWESHRRCKIVPYCEICTGWLKMLILQDCAGEAHSAPCSVGIFWHLRDQFLQHWLLGCATVGRQHPYGPGLSSRVPTTLDFLNGFEVKPVHRVYLILSVRLNVQ